MNTEFFRSIFQDPLPLLGQLFCHDKDTSISITLSMLDSWFILHLGDDLGNWVDFSHGMFVDERACITKSINLKCDKYLDDFLAKMVSWTFYPNLRGVNSISYFRFDLWFVWRLDCRIGIFRAWETHWWWLPVEVYFPVGFVCRTKKSKKVANDQTKYWLSNNTRKANKDMPYEGNTLSVSWNQWDQWTNQESTRVVPHILMLMIIRDILCRDISTVDTIHTRRLSTGLMKTLSSW